MNHLLRDTMVFALAAIVIAVIYPAQAGAVPTNMATAGTATAESVKYGSIAADANDGNRDGAFGNGSVWHSEDAANSNLRYWEVNLGSDMYLDRIETFARTDTVQSTLQNFRITVLNSSNTQIFTHDYFSTGAANDPWGTVDVRGLFGQTVRIQKLNTTPNYLNFAEFEVWGQTTPINANLLPLLPDANFVTRNSANVSVGAGASTTNRDAADGYIDGQYGHTDAMNGGSTIGSAFPIYHSSETGTATGGYWQADLGTLTDIDYINIFRRTNFLQNANSLTLQVLTVDNGAPVFSQALTMNVNDLNFPRYDLTVDLTNVTGRFIRIIDNDAGGNAALALAEVEVFAVPEPSSLTMLLFGGVMLWFVRPNGALDRGLQT